MSNKSIGRYIQLQGGFAFKSDDFKESGISLIRISNITLNGLDKGETIFLPDELGVQMDDFLAKEDDTLIAMSGATTGKCCIIKEKDLPCLINQRVGRFKIINLNEVDKKFVYYVVSSNQFQEELLKDAVGGAQPNVSPKQIERIQWDFPTKTEQQRIATILSTADAVIEKTQAAIAKYKAIKQGLLHDLFTRGIDIKTNKLRPTYQAAPQLYKETKLGFVPKEWEVERIDKLAAITTGSKDTQNKEESGEYPFFVRSQTIEKISSYSYDGEAILTSGDGVGVGKIYHYINGKFDFHQRVYMLYQFANAIVPKYLFYYFSNNFLAEVDKFSAKTTVDSVRMEMIAGMLVPLPKPNEQKLVAERLITLDNKLTTEQNYLHKMQQLKAGLMDGLLGGKRVCLNYDFCD